MRGLLDDVLLALIAIGIGALLREARRAREHSRLYCDDDGELLPIIVVSDEDNRRTN